ncbi:MAG TPA: L-threonylcarbamoyladenylate synthase [Bryobacteraceae bacterium]
MIDANELDRAGELIRAGRLVAFPTETVYGVGANALDPEAVARIYEAKGRPSSSPLIVHVSDTAMARTMAADWPALADALAAQFWPGPLTLIVRKAEIVPDLVTAGLPSVGLRVPSHPVALELIRRAGVPIAAPSANRFTEISPTTAAHVQASLGGRVDLILDGGPAQVGIESTVVSLVRNPPEILRPGMITKEDLEAASGVPWQRGNIDLPHVMESPGLHPRHYAPRTPFYVLERGEKPPAGRGRVLEMPGTAAEYAATLYTRLRAADLEGWDWIAVEKPIETPAWTGILDRLKRASWRA